METAANTPKWKTIHESIAIAAPKQKVWDVLTQEKYTSQWYQAFGPGITAQTDWKPGSKAVFTDAGKSGIIGRIKTAVPGQELVIEFSGQVIKGEEDYDSPDAKAIAGSTESYFLTEENGVTQLNTAADMGAAWYNQMKTAWDNAIAKIKELAERN